MKMKKLLKKYKHIWLLIYVPIYLVSFNLIEEIISPTSDYWVSYMPIDDIIPFNELFVIPYIFWYPFIFFTGIYLFFADSNAFRRMVWGIIIGFSTALIFYMLFPNGQNLRPAEFERDNILTQIMESIYRNDTNTNVLPSMHVIGSWVTFYAFLDCDRLRKHKLLVAAAFVISVLISLSTVFCKQHSFLDVIWGLIWSAVIYYITQIVMKKHMDKIERDVEKIDEAGVSD